MFTRVKRILRQTYGVIQKEFTLRTRYPLSFFSGIFTTSILSLIPLIFIYGGLLNLKNPNFFQIYYFLSGDKNAIYYLLLFDFLKSSISGSLNQKNYLNWLLIGNIIYTFSSHGIDAFDRRFMNEKFWGTVQGMVLAPINRYLILLGYIFTTIIESCVYFVVFITISYLIFPVSILQIFQVFFIACIMIIASGGIGLIIGTISLANENFAPAFLLVQFIILFFSCYSIPLEFFPDFFKGIVLINPYYHGTELARNIFLGTNRVNSIYSFLYILVFAIIVSSMGAYISGKIWTKYGVHGY